jgi:Snare region anchored in the vesicle membrane C-terminus
LADSHQRRDVATLQLCEQLLQQAKQCATAMQAIAEVENNAMRITESKYLLQRDIGPLSKEIHRILQQSSVNNQTTGTSTAANNRNVLFSSTTNHDTYHAPTAASSSHFNVESGNNNDTMLDALIQSSDELLRESQSILYETEGIGNQTIRQLVQQREQLINTHGTLHSLQTVMATSKTILTSMSRRACRNRLVLYMIIGALIALNLFVLHWIYMKKYSHHKSTPNNIEYPPNW